MKHLFLCSGILLLGWISPVSAQSGAGAAEYRTFTSQTGKEIRARLMRVDGDQVILRRSAGGEVPVPIAALSLDDQAYVQKWDPAERTRAVANEATGGIGLAQFMEAKGYPAAKLTQKGKSILVDVQINGKPYTFVFDSGRALSMIDSKVAKDNNMEIYDDVEFGKFPTQDGGVEPVLAGSMKSFGIAGLKIDAFEMGVCNLSRIGIDADGVMAADVLQYYDGIADWKSMILYFHPED